MFRFDQLIRPDMIVRDVRQRYPQTIPIMDEFGFREPCYDCEISVVACKHGLATPDVIEALNRAVFGETRETQ